MEYTKKHWVAASYLAREVHKGQLYGTEDYVDYHIRGVLKVLTRIFKASAVTTEVKILAILHDVLEDTDKPEEIEQRILEELGQDMLDKVRAISHTRAESYHRYMARVSEECLAVVMVKYADSYFNLEQCILEHNFVFAEKYMRNVKNLKAVVQEVLR